MAFDWKRLMNFQALPPATRRNLFAGIGVGALVLLGSIVWLVRPNPQHSAAPASAAGSGATPGAAGGLAAVPPAVGAPPPTAEGAGSTAVVANPEPIRTTARITFSTVPPVPASVMWGATKLGQIEARQSLVVTRPRDTGPLDVIVKANGYLPVHTRAHTFGDSRVVVKLTPPDQAATLLGYRVPIDAGVTESTEEANPLGPIPD